MNDENIDFMIKQIDEKLTTVDSVSQAIAYMIATYFSVNPPNENKKRQIETAINNCQKKAEHPLNSQFNKYFRKQLLDLVDDPIAKNKMLEAIKANGY